MKDSISEHNLKEAEGAHATKCPLLTVTIIAYHHEPYLARCLDSFLSQKTDFKFEIIIGDDCSNDGSEEILRQYEKEYPDVIKVIINEENLGASRNGMNVRSYVRGKYWLGFEGDDYLISDTFLQEAVDFLEGHPDVAGVCGGTVSVDAEGRNPVKSLSRFQLGRYYTYEDYAKYGYTLHGNTLVSRTDLYDETEESYKRLRNSAPTMGDVIIRCLVYEKGPIFALPTYVHAHRSGSSNPTSYSYAQKTKTIIYTDMCLDITCALEEYFADGRSYRTLYLNRIAEVTLGLFLGLKNVSWGEWWPYVGKLPISDRLRVFRKMISKFHLRVKRKLANKLDAETVIV